MLPEAENQNIEWKERWRDEYFKWICGFANAQGGTLILGKNDGGNPVGLTNTQWLLENLPNQVRNLLGIIVDINLLHEQGKALIEVVTPPYPNPISYKGKFYLRSGSTLQELNGGALQRFLLRKQGIRWDSVTVPRARIDDLDPAAFRHFRELAQRAQRLDSDALQLDNAALLDKLRLLEDHQLTRAALLLFHPEPDRFFTGASIKIGYFSRLNEVVYQDEIQGPLLLQVDQAMQALRLKYLRGWISYDGLQRVETYPVPLDALREALLNAVIHKDYSSGAPIQLRIYDDKLRLANTGQMPENWTLEKLTGPHNSQPYNPYIAHCFFRAGQIESWGQGVEKIMRLCQADGLPAPTYEFDGSFFTLYFTAHRPPVGMPVGGLTLDSTHEINKMEEVTLNKVHQLSEIVNHESEIVNELSEIANKLSSKINRQSDIITVDNTDAEWEKAWREANDKSHAFHIPPFNPSTGKPDWPRWSSPLVKEVVDAFGGPKAFLTLQENDEESKRRFQTIYRDTLKNQKPQNEWLMSNAVNYFQKNYQKKFKKSDYYHNVERLLAYICLQEGLKANRYAADLDMAPSTLARYIKELRNENIIEFVGATKSGGYFITDDYKGKIKRLIK